MIYTRRYKETKKRLPKKENPNVDDVKEAFESYTEEQMQYMKAEDLQWFLAEVQGQASYDAASQAETKKIIAEVFRRRHSVGTSLRRQVLTLDDFSYYLFSSEFNPALVSQVHHNMNAPLSHYFIYTSHNSYLTGNSECSDLPIADALKLGVRVVELDLWPDGNDDVCVLHGGTLSNPVNLEKCLETIKANAFTTSMYPVIITLQDHLTPELQKKVAKMITQTFGEMLYYSPDSESSKEFPSPEELKAKILISTKPPKEYLEDVANVRGKEPEDLISTRSELDKVLNGINDLTHDLEEREPCDFDAPCQSQAPVYKHLIAIHAEKLKGDLRMALKVDPNKTRGLSLSEPLLEKAVTSCGTDVIRFTQKNFLRIHPKATRLTSSNLKPQLGWMSGAQMIAINTQKYGRASWLMQGMFRANGGCGYVKKPDFLMEVGPNGQVFDPSESLPPRKTLKVKVCKGDGWNLDLRKTHFDLYSPPDFYVRVGIAGAPADEAMEKTKVKQDEWTPIWNEEFTFPLTVPELALLCVEVHEYSVDDQSDFAGQTCLPVSELRQGIRTVPLYDRKGKRYYSTRLLMRFEFS